MNPLLKVTLRVQIWFDLMVLWMWNRFEIKIPIYWRVTGYIAAASVVLFNLHIHNLPAQIFNLLMALLFFGSVRHNDKRYKELPTDTYNAMALDRKTGKFALVAKLFIVLFYSILAIPLDIVTSDWAGVSFCVSWTLFCFFSDVFKPKNPPKRKVEIKLPSLALPEPMPIPIST